MNTRDRRDRRRKEGEEREVDKYKVRVEKN